MPATGKLAAALVRRPRKAIGGDLWSLFCAAAGPGSGRRLEQDGRRSMRNPEAQDISAQAYLARLAERGIEYVFANAGTDFAPIIESLAVNANGRRKFPRVIIVPHENVAMAMAHGYYKIAQQAGGRDGACHRRYRQHHQRLDECGAGQHPDPARRRPHADHRDRPYRVAQPADPLGPGVVRPGRHGARIHQMGLRAALRAAGRRHCRPRARYRHERAARSSLSHAAARGAVRPRDRGAP